VPTAECSTTTKSAKVLRHFDEARRKHRAWHLAAQWQLLISEPASNLDLMDRKPGLQAMRSLNFLLIPLAILSLLFCGCASSSVKHTWKSPSYQGGPVAKVAVVVVTDRNFYRQAIENHFAGILAEQGQSALKTYDLFTLPEGNEARQAAAAQLRQAGADSVLVVRLVDSATYHSEARAASPAFTSSPYSYFMWGSGVSWSSLQRDLYLESSLYSLATSEHLWSGLTRTILKEDADAVAVIEPLAQKLFPLMRRDGVIH